MIRPRNLLAPPRGSFHIRGSLHFENLLRQAAAQHRRSIGELHDLAAFLVLLHLRCLDSDNYAIFKRYGFWLAARAEKAVHDAWVVNEHEKRQEKLKDKPRAANKNAEL